jgi:hypothetical protein
MEKAIINQASTPITEVSMGRLCLSIIGIGPKFGPTSRSKSAETIASANPKEIIGKVV